MFRDERGREREIETVKYVTRLHTAATPFHAIYIVEQLCTNPRVVRRRSLVACTVRVAAFIDVINPDSKELQHHTDKFFAAMAREKWTGLIRAGLKKASIEIWHLID